MENAKNSVKLVMIMLYMKGHQNFFVDGRICIITQQINASIQKKGCKEVYKTCELYDEIAQNKNQEDCESIDPPNIIDKSDNDYFSECKFENGHCIRKKRECEKRIKQ